jgi:hypothetical protein
MKSCLECEEKIIGREDKSFVATVVGMPTTIKSIRIVLIYMNVNNKLRKIHILSALNPMEIKTTELNC